MRRDIFLRLEYFLYYNALPLLIIGRRESGLFAIKNFKKINHAEARFPQFSLSSALIKQASFSLWFRRKTRL